MKLLVCTDKGLVEYEFFNNSRFEFKTLHFRGQPIGYVDVWEKIWRAAINHKHWGAKIQQSNDQGKSWFEINTPKFPSSAKTSGEPPSLKAIWNITAIHKNSFYVGVEPAALFYTYDGGKDYEFIQSLWEHPTRKLWMGGGKGSLNPFLHHILIHPEDEKHIYVAISCAGVFESLDGGNSWEVKNKGLRADFLPNPDAEAGHDPHNLKMASKNPNVIWQQNHCGIFRSKNGGNSWMDLSGNLETSSYGFALAIDKNNDRRAWIIPCESDSMRIPSENKLAVFTTSDSGNSWRRLANGFPQENVFDIVLRHALDISNSHLVFGTNNGNLYHSQDYGESWSSITNNLSTVRHVKLIA